MFVSDGLLPAMNRYNAPEEVSGNQKSDNPSEL
jgi:hypothetical protein